MILRGGIRRLFTLGTLAAALAPGRLLYHEGSLYQRKTVTVGKGIPAITLATATARVELRK